MNQPAAMLLCPKCTAEMRSYERNGVTVDQCTSCKGVFLDRGELDRLIDAEGSFYEAGSRTPAPQAAYPSGHERHDRDDRYRSDDDYRRGKKKKHSFLSELFD
jgi:Zn-finger nucleic acid-binding protein